MVSSNVACLSDLAHIAARIAATWSRERGIPEGVRSVSA